MSKELELYKAFIDGLVERKDSVTARWVKGDGFPHPTCANRQADGMAETGNLCFYPFRPQHLQ